MQNLNFRQVDPLPREAQATQPQSRWELGLIIPELSSFSVHTSSFDILGVILVLPHQCDLETGQRGTTIKKKKPGPRAGEAAQ